MKDLILNKRPVKINNSIWAYSLTGLHFPASWKGCEKRVQPITHIVLHWTGGEGDGRQVYNVLKNRGLAVEFFINHEGQIFQFADPSRVACRAVGNGFWRRSISIEVQNFGFRRDPKQIPLIGQEREKYRDTINGHQFEMADFFPAQKEAIANLLKTLCDHYDIDYSCPVHKNERLIRRRLKNAERDSFGILGHFHLTKRKSDPGTKIFEDLFGAG